MIEIAALGVGLQLLPERAVYIPSLETLLVSDVHLGKSETFQLRGIAIPNQVNQDSLQRLQDLCLKLQPKHLIVLGDLFHSKAALVDQVLTPWLQFLDAVQVDVQLIIGNHDRHLLKDLHQFSIHCIDTALPQGCLIFSHEPAPQPACFNLCGHIHPCLKVKSKLDQLRLPCFYLERSKNLLILPAFGAFTGGYEVELHGRAIAYVPVENTLVPFHG